MEENITKTAEERWYTIEDCARLLHVSISMAYKLIDPPHNLPAVKVGRVWRVSPAKFRAWREELAGKVVRFEEDPDETD